jgi:hypothetical protein
MQPADKFTPLGISRDNGRMATFGIAKGFFPEEYTETTVLLNASMAADTMFIENGLYLCAVINGLAFPATNGQYSGKKDGSDAGQYPERGRIIHVRRAYQGKVKYEKANMFATFVR